MRRHYLENRGSNNGEQSPQCQAGQKPDSNQLGSCVNKYGAERSSRKGHSREEQGIFAADRVSERAKQHRTQRSSDKTSAEGRSEGFKSYA
jgi:hypothetical protein